MNIDELTIGQAKDLVAIFGGGTNATLYPVEIGKAYCFRGVTYHWVGKVVAVIGSYAVLETAAWVADSGRFSEFIQNGTVAECEAVSVPVRVNMDACMDIIDWRCALLREVV